MGCINISLSKVVGQHFLAYGILTYVTKKVIYMTLLSLMAKKEVLSDSLALFSFRSQLI